MPEVTAIEMRVLRLDGTSTQWSVGPKTGTLTFAACDDNRRFAMDRVEEDQKLLEKLGFKVEEF